MSRPEERPLDWPRLLLGALIAPILAPATYAAVAVVTGGFLSFQIALEMGEFAYAAAVICAPALVFLSRLGWSSLHDHIVFGFLMGFVGGSLTADKPLALSIMPLLAFYGLCGAIAAAAFWLIVRPDAA